MSLWSTIFNDNINIKIITGFLPILYFEKKVNLSPFAFVFKIKRAANPFIYIVKKKLHDVYHCLIITHQAAKK